MHPHCISEASTGCFRGCCSASFLGLPEFWNPGSPSCSKDGDFIAATVSSLPPNTQFTNHESLPSLPESFSNFTKSYPQFLLTNQSDQIRAQHYSHLSASKHVCLDYTGHGLFSFSQQHQNDTFFQVRHKSITLNSQILYGGGEEAEFESRIQERIMTFMNISQDDYFMVFTANKSSAFKLLADSYPFDSNTNLVTVYDHESEAIEGMIQIATRKGAKVRSAVFSWPNLRVHFKKLKKILMSKRNKKGLFVIPLQSGITGARCSYMWMSMAQENGWHVLLDASSLGAKDMDTLGLSLFKPDFLICSFYKIFGDNPSGFGSLFIKKSAASLFSNSGTGIGIVSLIPPQNVPDQMKFRDKDKDIAGPSSLFEHLRSEILEIVEVDEPAQSNQTMVSGKKGLEFQGLDNADTLGLVLISSRTRCLVNWLVNALMKLRHPNSENGLKLVRIYGPKIRIDRGPAVAFNVFDWKGEKIDPMLVQKLADRNSISLGCGFLRHIWFPNKYELEKERLLELRKDGIKILEEHFHPKVYVLTVSIGFLNNFEDLYRLWAFVSRFLDADFVEKERWRYLALNQTTIEF